MMAEKAFNVLLVAVMIFSLAESARAETAVTLEVVLASVPPEIGGLDTAGLWVGKKLRGVLPATIKLDHEQETFPLHVTIGQLGFKGTLHRNSDSTTIAPGPNPHCQPFDGEWTVATPASDTISVTLHIRKIGEQDCIHQSSIGSPDGKGKLKFTTSPEGGTLYYPSYDKFIVKATPVTLVVDFTTQFPDTVVFKKTGYYDCTVELSFTKESGTYFVTAKGTKLGPMTDNSTTAPSIVCQFEQAHKPAPSPGG